LKYAAQIQAHNISSLACGGGVALLVEGSCIGHIVHRELEHHFATKSLIPNLYSTAFSCSLPGSYEAIIKAVKERSG